MSRADVQAAGRPDSRPGVFAHDGAFVVGGKLLLLAFLCLGLLFPLFGILRKAFDVTTGSAAGLGYAHFFRLVGNSLKASATTVLVVVPAGYFFAYALQRTRIVGRSVFRGISLLPLMAPSMFAAISLVYLFGNQGLLKSWMPGGVYGFPGIVLGQVFYNFPTAVMIFVAALSLADARLYDAAVSMGASHLRIFRTVTWPSTRYAVFTASCLVFTQTMTDFGIPAVIGGDYQVLSMEAYKAVVGQQQFGQGAVIGLLLLIPSVLSFLIDRRMRRLHGGQLESRAVNYRAPHNLARDGIYLLVLIVVSVAFLSVVLVAVGASFITFWPYNLSPTLAHYDFESSGDVGWLAYGNSLKLSALTACAGTPIIFTCAYLMDRTTGGRWMQPVLRFLCLMPMAVPGLVLGLGYVFFFNARANPLNGLYGGLLLMTACTIVHYLTPSQMTATAALRQLSREIEPASLSLKAPLLRTYWQVIVPICLPTVVEIWRYLFVSALSSMSALIFLYSPDTILASVAILNMDDAGNIGGAAALAALILLTSIAVSLVLKFVVQGLLQRTQRWRNAAGH